MALMVAGSAAADTYPGGDSWLPLYTQQDGTLSGCIDPGRAYPGQGGWASYDTTEYEAAKSAYLWWKYGKKSSSATEISALSYWTYTTSDLPHDGAASAPGAGSSSVASKYSQMVTEADKFHGPYTFTAALTTSPTATSGTAKMRFTLTSAAGHGLAGIPVTFTATGAATGMTPSSATTNSSGEVTVTFELANGADGGVKATTGSVASTKVKMWLPGNSTPSRPDSTGNRQRMVSAMSTTLSNTATASRQPGESRVSVRKTDSQTGSPVGGAKVDVQKGNATLATGTTDANGNWTSPLLNLPPGTWVRIHETAAPNGYYRDTTTFFAATTADGTGSGGSGTDTDPYIGRVPIKNVPQGKVSVHKTDASTNSGLGGATFQVFKGTTATGTVLASGTSNAAGDWTSGFLGSGVQIGDQVTIKETAAPATYLLGATTTRTVTVTRDGSGAARWPVSNPPQGKVSIIKRDGTTNGGLAGAVFQVRKGSASGQVVGTINSSASGAATSGYLTGDVKVGDTVWLVETTTPAGYTPASPVQVTVTRDGTSAGRATINNKRVFAQASISKIDSISGNRIPGVSFRAEVKPVGSSTWTTVSGGATAGTYSGGVYITDSVGLVAIDGKNSTPTLEYGDSIRFTETAPAPGYVMPTTPLVVEGIVDVNGDLEVTAANSPQRTVQVTKLDMLTGTPLPGAAFTICYAPTGRSMTSAETAAAQPCTVPAGVALVDQNGAAINPADYKAAGTLTTDTTGTTPKTAPMQYAQIGDRIAAFETSVPDGYEAPLTSAVTVITAAGNNPQCQSGNNQTGTPRPPAPGGNTISCVFYDQPTAAGSITKTVDGGWLPEGATYQVTNTSRNIDYGTVGPADSTGLIDGIQLPGTYLGDTVTFTETAAPYGSALDMNPVVTTVTAESGAAVAAGNQHDPALAIGTTATTSQQKYVPIGGGTVTDTVTYTGLTPGTNYTITGQIMAVQADGQALPTGVEATIDFTADTTQAGSVQLEFHIPAQLEGNTLVVFEQLWLTGQLDADKPLAEHNDAEDAAQIVFFPAAATSAVNADTSFGRIALPGHTVIDTVTVCAAQPGAELLIVGAATGVDADGNNYPVEMPGASRVTPDNDGCNDYKVTFTVGGGAQPGSTIVFAETIYQVPAGADSDWLPDETDLPVAVHADLSDPAQTVFYPAIGTSAVDTATGSQNLSSGSVTDTVAYTGLQPGVQYVASGTIHVVECDADGAGPAGAITPASGSGFDCDSIVTTDTGVQASTVFTPDEQSGTVDVVFDVPARLAGTTLVVYESVTIVDGGGDGSQDLTVAVHADPTDTGQYIWSPAITTTANNSAAELGKLAQPGGDLVDTVTYTGVQPGKQYRLAGEFHTVIDGVIEPTGVVGETVFTPETSAGTVDVAFHLADDTDLLGVDLVAFEMLWEGGTLLASHTDINDPDQTVTVPRITTSAANTVAEFGKNAVPGHRVIDTVTWTNLTPGVEYTLTGTLNMVDSDGGLRPVGEPSVVVFTPEESDGTIEVPLDVPDRERIADASGQRLIVFETVTQSGFLVALHADPMDENQAVYVPAISTTAVNIDPDLGKHARPGDTVTDTVTYTGFAPGMEYTVDGRLHQVNPDGNIVPLDVTGSTVFTPDVESGTVDVEFHIPKDMADTGRQWVAFQTVTVNGVQVAEHHDPHDPDQTVFNPAVATTLADVDGNKIGITPDVALIDQVEYRGLVPGVEYTIFGELRIPDGTVGGIVTDATAQVTFTPNSPDGTETVVFSTETLIDNPALLEAQKLVAFETITPAASPGKPVAVHHDIADESQTITVDALSFTTTDDGVGINAGLGASGHRTSWVMVWSGIAGLLIAAYLGVALVRRHRRASL